MAYGKGRATGYSDFYKNNSKTPDGETESEVNDYSSVPATAAEKRKAALKRRMQKLKMGN